MALYKYAGWTFDQVEALLNILGEDTAYALLAGKLTVERVNDTLVVKEAVKTLFDKNGRCIPPKGLVSAVCDPNRDFYLVQLKLDFGIRLHYLEQAGIIYTMSLADFEGRANDLIAKVSEEEQTKNLLKGVYLPILIPQMKVEDLGQATEELVAAAEKSYKQQFPQRSFINHRKGELKGRVNVVEGSRYEQLLERLAKEAVVGIYFPNPLQGFSVHAQREQMATLPEGFILSGPLDTAVGWIMYPDVLGRDYKTPVNDCSAVNWRSPGSSLFFRADGDEAGFDYGGDLSGADGYYSGGLLFVG